MIVRHSRLVARAYDADPAAVDVRTDTLVWTELTGLEVSPEMGAGVAMRRRELQANVRGMSENRKEIPMLRRASMLNVERPRSPYAPFSLTLRMEGLDAWRAMQHGWFAGVRVVREVGEARAGVGLLDSLSASDFNPVGRRRGRSPLRTFPT